MDAPALRAPGGPVVDVAKGVAKPRTRHAVAEGSVTIQAGPPVWDCVVGHQSPGEAASRVGRPAFGSHDTLGAGLQWHVSEGARKCMGGSARLRPRLPAPRTNTRKA